MEGASSLICALLARGHFLGAITVSLLHFGASLPRLKVLPVNLPVTRLHLKHVHQFRDRHGKLRHYFRRGGSKAIPLPGLVGSEEFMAAHQAALMVTTTSQEIGADRTIPGTINALVVAYYRSTEWTGLTADTRDNRRPTIERFRIAYGSKRVALLQRAHIERMMANIPKLSARRRWLTTIRSLLQAAIPIMRKDNPTAGIATVRLPKSKGHHTWTDAEIQQYRNHWPLGTQQRLVFRIRLGGGVPPL